MPLIALLLSCSIFVLSCKNSSTAILLPYYNTPNFTPIFVNNPDSLSIQIPHRIANFSFKDQHDKLITQKDIEEKIHVADFFFTSCGSICPIMTKHMKMIDSALSSDQNLVLLSYSVTPWIDTVKVLKEYASRNNITNPNWHLLTGTKGAIYNLARQSYFAEEDLGFSKDSTNFLHTEHFLLIDKQKRIRGIYNGTLQLEIEQLVKDAKQLLKE